MEKLEAKIFPSQEQVYRMSEKKKKLSGYQNLLNKRKREEELENHVKITHFFSKPESTLPNINNNNNTAESQYSEPVLETSISSRRETDLESNPSTSSSSADNEKSTPSKITRTENMSQLSKDAALWPKKLRPNNIQELVERGPAHYKKNYIYPRDSSDLSANRIPKQIINKVPMMKTDYLRK
ncbi:hypothetical protein JTB14_027045 [Gonioctena quinquepunctata]|nr:hypothetical protein JTB14_027045 [Gonioctena quinquepunctata]